MTFTDEELAAIRKAEGIDRENGILSYAPEPVSLVIKASNVKSRSVRFAWEGR